MALESSRPTRVPEAGSLLDQARLKLSAPAAAADNLLPALAAAALLAVCAVGFVAVSVLAPATSVAPAFKKGVNG